MRVTAYIAGQQSLPRYEKARSMGGNIVVVAGTTGAKGAAKPR